ncbi:MAG: flagellar biosynthetic protein FliR [Gammaproteobacteria bacterium]|nr:flagellar biosynthetic protein FliR [Gammaproteobacteria bacterium]
MAIAIDPAFVILVLLISVRLGVLFAFSPLFAITGMPPQTRVFLVLGMSWILASTLPEVQRVAATQTVDIIEMAASELVYGGLMAFGVHAAFSAFMLAGNLLDIQLGFAVGEIVDPASQERLPVIGTFLNLVAVTVFFAVDGHHLVLQAFADTIAVMPPGTPFSLFEVQALIRQFGAIFSIGVLLAAPVLIALLMADIGFAVAARFMPQMNVFIVALSAKILLGLALLFIVVDNIPYFIRRIPQALIVYWDSILR